MYHIARLASLLLGTLAVCVFISGCTSGDTSKGSGVTKLRFASADGQQQSPELTVEVMSSEQSRQRGLMFRKELPDLHGMLFIFPETKVQGFWMKNTFLPLDMIFVSSELQVVGVLEDVPPLTEDVRSVEAPSMYVLEFFAGTAKKLGVSVGSKVIPLGPLPRAID